MAQLSPQEMRERIRSGQWQGPTAGCCTGFAQANLVVVPRALAQDFLLFCQRNPEPCPLLAVTDPGGFACPTLAADADLRTDLPRYRVYRDGELAQELPDLLEVWRDDLVSFLLGCSFTFDAALQEAGIPVRHVEERKNVPMYVTNRSCHPAGVFAGPLVVTMRPIPSHQVECAAEITTRYPLAHGAPVYTGDPAAIGIADLEQPDFGDAVSVAAGEIPVFWACGVTPQAVAMRARPQLMVTQVPGHMFITDWRHAEL
ncbi:MAG: putative hydro-lyase [Gemmatimonadales bacterium]|nr:putative hydro-lyase [Gemmatimonadales bacterium]NIN11866.1 putative hydro-lyase [Gemmatimonadales bacterium]NIN50416.1 putative hydro-lyase [Gemmatimonadales bacterium]NIP07880.1 putative hydro-lyase [Gemmatimonadales bacterium]NIR02084.1 putative hydro-lyase [Gemmatimonadales bacterium]